MGARSQDYIEGVKEAWELAELELASSKNLEHAQAKVKELVTIGREAAKQERTTIEVPTESWRIVQQTYDQTPQIWRILGVNSPEDLLCVIMTLHLSSLLRELTPKKPE
jgi:hypothetical protein